MSIIQKIILITGPGGSGKTTLSEYIGKKSDFLVVSEDNFWSQYRAEQNRSVNDLRSLEEEAVIQSRVIDYVHKKIQLRQNVVLEFILYCDPPRPLLAYKKAFDSTDAQVVVAVLYPSVPAIISRKQKRGRDNEQNIAEEIEITSSQFKILESSYIDRGWILDNSDMDIETTCRVVMERFT